MVPGLRTIRVSALAVWACLGLLETSNCQSPTAPGNVDARNSLQAETRAETQDLYFDFLHKGDRRHRLMELAAKEAARSTRKVRLRKVRLRAGL